MIFAAWVTVLNILAFAALIAAIVYLFVLVVRALQGRHICRPYRAKGKVAIRGYFSPKSAKMSVLASRARVAMRRMRSGVI